jgi:hypothetical protein
MDTQMELDRADEYTQRQEQFAGCFYPLTRTILPLSTEKRFLARTIILT